MRCEVVDCINWLEASAMTCSCEQCNETSPPTKDCVEFVSRKYYYYHNSFEDENSPIYIGVQLTWEDNIYTAMIGYKNELGTCMHGFRTRSMIPYY
jgi:hypothetical protein